MTKIEDMFIGESPQLAELLRQIRKAAATDSTVLISGETGTGKELVAQAIHAASKRAEGPLVAVNCAAVPESLLESEMFGYEKGAFTGAAERRAGEFERAAGGTLFLDEIGEMPLSMQPKLLRVLQEREAKRLGGARPVKLDIRIIAATNRNLRVGFRSDLYYRLNVIAIQTPPLRDRPQDILVLARHFPSIFSRHAGRTVHGISPEAEFVLKRYKWPGNVRELQNVIERAVTMGSSEWITREDLPEFAADDFLDYNAELAEAKRGAIRRAYALADGDHETASALLGLNSNYLYELAKKFNMSHLRRPPGPSSKVE